MSIEIVLTILNCTFGNIKALNMINSDGSAVNDKDSRQEQPVKIILAEDDKDDQELFIEALSAAQVSSEVRTVDNGGELIDSLKDQAEPTPDIIFMDINMPVKSGKEALAEIKNDHELKDIPVVMLSTSDHPKDIEDTFNIGADLYIQKPNSFNGFIRILKKVFNLHWTKGLLSPLKNLFFISEKNISQRD